MTFHLAPGVYLEEAIEAAPLELRTGVPAFVGFAGFGPLGDDESPRSGAGERLRSFDAFQNTYGDGPADSYLPAAVRGFFRNGGEVCRVVRIQDTREAGRDPLHAALESLADVDDVDLVCAPDLTRTTDGTTRGPEEVLADQAAVRDHCTAQQRVAILDAPPGADTPTTLGHAARLASPHAALYHPWIVIEGGRRVPPCGHVAGVYARCDARVGPHKAPANEPLEGVLDLERPIGDAEQSPLDGGGVNCLRALPGRGIRVFGARTLSADPAWRFVNVRRVATGFERWAARALAALCFEPNGPPLWSRARRELSARCEDLWRQGALAGAAAQEAYFVRCDAETNTPADRDAGRLIAVAGLAVVAPAQFVIVRVVGEASPAVNPGPGGGPWQ